MSLNRRNHFKFLHRNLFCHIEKAYKHDFYDTMTIKYWALLKLRLNLQCHIEMAYLHKVFEQVKCVSYSHRKFWHSWGLQTIEKEKITCYRKGLSSLCLSLRPNDDGIYHLSEKAYANDVYMKMLQLGLGWIYCDVITQLWTIHKQIWL